PDQAQPFRRSVMHLNFLRRVLRRGWDRRPDRGTRAPRVLPGLEALEARDVPSFASPINYAVGHSPQAVVTGDFNNAGKADLAVTNYVGSSVSIFLGKGDATFQSAVNYTVESGPSAVAAGDFNGDRKADLVVANASSNTVSTLLNNGDGTFASAVSHAVG